MAEFGWVSVNRLFEGDETHFIDKSDCDPDLNESIWGLVRAIWQIWSLIKCTFVLI